MLQENISARQRQEKDNVPKNVAPKWKAWRPSHGTRTLTQTVERRLPVSEGCAQTHKISEKFNQLWQVPQYNFIASLLGRLCQKASTFFKQPGEPFIIVVRSIFRDLCSIKGEVCFLQHELTMGSKKATEGLQQSLSISPSVGDTSDTSKQR